MASKELWWGRGRGTRGGNACPQGSSPPPCFSTPAAMQASVLQIENTSESDPCSYGATKAVAKKNSEALNSIEASEFFQAFFATALVAS